MDPTVVMTTIGIGTLLAVVVNFVKTWIELWLKPDDARHDPTIRIVAGALGVIGYVVHAATLAPLTGPEFWDAALNGAFAGVAAVGTYHGVGAVAAKVATKPTVEVTTTA